MPLTLHPIAYSETGLVRKTNQDSGYVSSSMLLVADGMGGAAGGDLASAAVVRLMRHAADAPADGETLAALQESVEQATATIAAMIVDNPDLDGMGTTVSGGIFDGTAMNIVHMGDSRGYLLSEGRLRRLTHDHSFVQSLIDDGRLDEEAAMSHPHRSLLLKVLNGQTEIIPDYFAVPVQAGDRIMFCSDGLCGLVTDPDIAAGLALPDLDQAMTALIDMAHEAGCSDNVTIAMADVVELRVLSELADGADIPAGPDSVDSTGTMPVFDYQNPLPVSRFTTSGLIGAAADPRVTALLKRMRRRDAAIHLGPRSGARTSEAAQRLTPTMREKQRYAPASRRTRRGFWLIGLAIVIGLAGAGWGVYAYVSSQYFIGDYQGSVAIYQGLPGDIAGFETARVHETTNIALTDLPVVWRDQVTATIQVTSGGLDKAHETLQKLRDFNVQCINARAQRPPGSPVPSDGC